MESRTVRIDQISDLNHDTYIKKDLPDLVEYLDTGSLTDNKILFLQTYSRDSAELPSRAQRKVKNNTILYSTVRPNLKHYGILEKPPHNIVVSTGFTTIDIHDDSVDPKFIYYAITQEHITRYLHTIASNNVSSYPSINSDDIGRLTLSIPCNLETQKRIAAVLSSLDAKIELNNRINAELEAMAKTLYDYWFVQFDFPDKNGKPYKSSGGKMVWSTELKREIPEGWDVGSLLDIADYINGLPCQKYRPIASDSLRVIKIKEMHEGFSSETELVRTDIPEKSIINNGDVLFSWSASLEVQIWTRGKGALNQHIFKVESNKYPKTFYYYQLVNYLNHFKMMAENRKTTMGHITQDHLYQSRIILPPKEIAEKLDFGITPLFDKMINNEIQNHQLTELRDWLLPMLMNGQVKVQ